MRGPRARGGGAVPVQKQHDVVMGSKVWHSQTPTTHQKNTIIVLLCKKQDIVHGKKKGSKKLSWLLEFGSCVCWKPPIAFGCTIRVRMPQRTAATVVEQLRWAKQHSELFESVVLSFWISNTTFGSHLNWH